MYLSSSRGGASFNTVCAAVMLFFIVCMKAWWMTNVTSTDIWARWSWTDGKWNYTEIPSHYSQGLCTSVELTLILTHNIHHVISNTSNEMCNECLRLVAWPGKLIA